jgi:hypothetical protein
MWRPVVKEEKRKALNPKQLDELLKRLEKSSLQASDYEFIEAMAERIKVLSKAVKENKIPSRKKLRKILGGGTEGSKG